MNLPLEAITKNLMTILTCKKTILPVEKQLFQRTTGEIGLTQELYLKYNDEWASSPKTILRGVNPEEDLLILSYLLGGAYFDNMIYREERQILEKYEEDMGLKGGSIDAFIEAHQSLEFSGKVSGTILEIRNFLKRSGLDIQKSDTGKSDVLHPQDKLTGRSLLSGVQVKGVLSRAREQGALAPYVATQVSSEGIDELQSISLCYSLGLNAALSGPPGVGKTESVGELASYLEVPLYTKVCSGRTTESHIISHPVLEEQNGVTVTAHEDGPLCLAMMAPGIFYGDEYNLLKEDVQKRLNSAFDDRRSIDRNDGSMVKAERGFFALISYNPTQVLGQRDLEDSVADRFVHFHYQDWPPELKAYISHLKVMRKQDPSRKENPDYRDFGISLETRGFGAGGEFLLEIGRDQYVDFWTKKPLSDVKPVYRYQVIRTGNLWTGVKPAGLDLDALGSKSLDGISLAKVLARMVHVVNEMAVTGRSSHLKSLGLEKLAGEEEMELLSCHQASTRIVTAALQHYHHMVSLGWNRYLAQTYAAGIVVNQMAFGAYRERKLKDSTTWEVLSSLAAALGLYADTTTYNTDLSAPPKKSSAGNPTNTASGPSPISPGAKGKK